jgi:hypothetical protein
LSEAGKELASAYFRSCGFGLIFGMICGYKYMQMRPKGDEAARLRQQKYAWLRRFKIPAEALPGSLSLTHRRCGKSNCCCTDGEGHPLWQLTFMVDGKKRVERIPEEWVEQVRRRVEEGREFKRAMVEVFAANAQLLVLERRQRQR